MRIGKVRISIQFISTALKFPLLSILSNLDMR